MTRHCAICGIPLARREAETAWAWRERRACGKECGHLLRSQTMAGRPYIPADQGVRPEDSDKVARAFRGTRFDEMRLRPVGAARLPARETHVPYAAPSSWASE